MLFYVYDKQYSLNTFDIQKIAFDKLKNTKRHFSRGVGGIGGSGVQSKNQKIFGERHFRLKRVDFFDALN